MTSFNEPERNLAAEAREREERENHPTATRSRSPGRYGDRNMTSDMGQESPWKPVSELLLDHDALVGAAEGVSGPIGGCPRLSYCIEHLAHRVRG